MHSIYTAKHDKNAKCVRRMIFNSFIQISLRLDSYYESRLKYSQYFHCTSQSVYLILVVTVIKSAAFVIT